MTMKLTLLLGVAAVLGAAESSQPPVNPNLQWNQMRANGANSGHARGTTLSEGAAELRFAAPGILRASPVSFGGRVYLPIGDGLVILDKATGTVLQRLGEPGESFFVPVACGSKDGRNYACVPSSIPEGTAVTLWREESDGTGFVQVWRRILSGLFIHSAITLSHKRIFFTAYGQSGMGLACLDADGNLRWFHPGSGGGLMSAKPAAHQQLRRVYYRDGNRVICLDDAGNEVANFPALTARDGEGYAFPLVLDAASNRLYQAGSGSDGEGIVCADAGTGAVLWDSSTQGLLSLSTEHAVVADGSFVYGFVRFPDGTFGLACLDAGTGAVVWQRPLPAGLEFSAWAARTGNGRLWCAAAWGQDYHCLDAATGQLLGSGGFIRPAWLYDLCADADSLYLPEDSGVLRLTNGTP